MNESKVRRSLTSTDIFMPDQIRKMGTVSVLKPQPQQQVPQHQETQKLDETSFHTATEGKENMPENANG